MIELVRGELLRKTTSNVVVDVGGIGLQIWIPLTVYENIGGVGTKVELRTYLHVREDTLQLYGFNGDDDRKLFEKMLGVTGVGPKLALTILSRFSPAELTDVVAAGDAKRLSAVKGIGPKTAQRLLIEFKGKVEIAMSDSVRTPLPERSLFSGAIQALEALGYSTADGDEAVRRAIGKVGTDASLEDVIKQALKG